MATFRWPRAFRWPMPPTRGPFGAGSDAWWSSSPRWRHNSQQLPPLLSGTALNCTHSWGPSRPSDVAWAIPAGLALLTAKGADQCLCPHNSAGGLTMELRPLNCPTRIGETGYKPTRDSKEKESNVDMRRDTGRLSEVGKIGFHFLLVFTFCWYLWERRQQYFAADCALAWWCSTDEHSNNRHKPTKLWLKITPDRLFCSLRLPAVPAQEVLLWSWVNHHCSNRNYWSHGSTERKIFMLLLISF